MFFSYLGPIPYSAENVTHAVLLDASMLILVGIAPRISVLLCTSSLIPRMVVSGGSTYTVCAKPSSNVSAGSSPLYSVYGSVSSPMETESNSVSFESRTLVSSYVSNIKQGDL